MNAKHPTAIDHEAGVSCFRALCEVVDKIEALQELDEWDQDILEIAFEALEPIPDWRELFIELHVSQPAPAGESRCPS